MANLPLTEFAVPDYPDDVFIIGEQEREDITTLQNKVAALEETTEGIPAGTFPELTAGSVLSKDAYTKDTLPYLYRAMPYVSKRLEDVLVGGSVVWNQLCNATSVTLTSGHKYYMKKDGTETVGASDGTALTGLTVGTDIVRDLTQMLGSTIADYINSLGSTDGVSFLKRYFITIGVYDSYDTGTIKSVEATAHVTRGINQFDGETESGYYDVADGTAQASGTWKRNKNPIPCIPNETYHYTNGGTGSFGAMLYYDADDNYIGYSSAIISMNYTTPSNAHYIRFYVSRNQTDICINISDPTINGEYFPYEEHNYDLGNVPLYGLFQLENGKLKAYGDVRHAEGGTDRKFGLVDLGTLNWTYMPNGDSATSNLPYFYSTAINTRKTNANMLCGKYVVASGGRETLSNNSLASFNLSNNTAVCIADSSYTDAAALKTAMSGVYLVYELATPTTETTTPFEQYQVCETGGTEEYITTNDVPVGHDTKYFTDVIGNIEDIPAPPTADGTYTLKVTVSSGVPTYAWV